jgi:hypothetical protein
MGKDHFEKKYMSKFDDFLHECFGVDDSMVLAVEL